MRSNSYSASTTAARTRRVLFMRARQQPATPIGNLRFAAAGSVGLFNVKRASTIANSGCRRPLWKRRRNSTSLTR
jgi:hypothetical protein